MLRLAYPPVCIGCDVSLEDETTLLCPDCLRGLRRANSQRVTARLTHLPANHGVIDSVFALWLFEPGGALQKVHHQLKYGNRPTYGIRLGTQIGLTLQSTHPADTSFDAIIPTPLHRARLYERGYNQSVMLARGIADVLQAPVREDVLVRTRFTLSQTKLTRPERWNNVDGAFTVRMPEIVRGARILLVDDVFTTGATLLAAATALRHAGAASITAATLAYAEK